MTSNYWGLTMNTADLQIVKIDKVLLYIPIQKYLNYYNFISNLQHLNQVVQLAS